MADGPGGYNGVFDYRDGQIFCLNSNSTEMSCFDYPLADGTMVRQYFYSGVTSYTIFRYRPNGEIVEISRLFDRGDDPGYHAGKPSPQYEIDGKEVDEREFNQKLEELITSKRINEQSWKNVKDQI
ncbi:MAG: hypothetical protein IKM19_07625 [Firmicutes bacterium]|nr:hypothetical protein [Bacillota bacterium]